MKCFSKPSINEVWGYDPFGMGIVGRDWQVGSGYRYGFNGKERDPETYGEGNIYDYGFRIYNARLGRFLSVDPLTQSFPWYTPYQFAGNKPIAFIDLDGLEDVYFTKGLVKTGDEEAALQVLYTSPEFQADLKEFKDPAINKGYDIIISENTELVLQRNGFPAQAITYATFENNVLSTDEFKTGKFGQGVDQNIVDEIAAKGRGLIIIAVPIGSFEASTDEAKNGTWYSPTEFARTLGHEFKHGLKAAKLGYYSYDIGEQDHYDFNLDPTSTAATWPAGERSPHHTETMLFYPKSPLGTLYIQITNVGNNWTSRGYEYVQPINQIQPQPLKAKTQEPTIKPSSNK
ncbi:MAG: RHS repeat-associated core domain-containing protein [Bacteroidetes bacterium]|nr:RHS repeat-associated core domain-containing protein [Bacteroidota bacterium]